MDSDKEKWKQLQTKKKFFEKKQPKSMKSVLRIYIENYKQVMVPINTVKTLLDYFHVFGRGTT